MALETMVGVTEIRGEKVLQERIKNPDGSVNWQATDEARKEAPIYVDHEVNMISFRIQNGPIKEVGKNGCQVVEMIAVAKHIIEKLNAKFPSHYNEQTLAHLASAIEWQNQRTKDRETRGVEGKSQA